MGQKFLSSNTVAKIWQPFTKLLLSDISVLYECIFMFTPKPEVNKLTFQIFGVASPWIRGVEPIATLASQGLVSNTHEQLGCHSFKEKKLYQKRNSNPQPLHHETMHHRRNCLGEV